jgi:hypothetical protein
MKAQLPFLSALLENGLELAKLSLAKKTALPLL